MSISIKSELTRIHGSSVIFVRVLELLAICITTISSTVHQFPLPASPNIVHGSLNRMHTALSAPLFIDIASQVPDRTLGI